MKFPSQAHHTALALLFVSAIVAAQEVAPEDDVLVGPPCLPADAGFSLYFKGRCSYDDLVTRIGIEIERVNPSCGHSASQEAQLLLNVVAAESIYTHCEDEANEDAARSAVRNICDVAFASQTYFPWTNVTNKAGEGEPLFDEIYYDGGTAWNEEYRTSVENRVPYVPGVDDNILKYDARRVDDIYESVAREMGISYPDDAIDNFADCPLRSAMCCWVSDRQANDNNGNCATPYDENCVDADPSDNTDICYVDLSRSTQSNGVKGGFALFDGDDGNGEYNAEGPAHCHGIAWPTDLTEPESRYRGNNLFFVSMYDHLYNRGYVRNVPGAPMCGCVSKMPVVSRADCTEIAVDEIWIFDYVPGTGFAAKLDPDNGVSIAFNACTGANNRNNDLEAYYRRFANEGRATANELAEVQKTIVGNGKCAERRNEFVRTMGFEPIESVA